MKRAILLLCVVLSATALMGTNDTYYKKMGETIGQFNSCRSIEDFRDLANKFRVIANVETKEWLPLYYEAYCYIIMSFMDGTNAASKDGYLDQANTLINKMLEMAPEESEAYTLQAFYYTGRLVVNPPERAQTTAPMISAALGKALGLEPGNPRAMYMKLSNELGTARYFGSDTESCCIKAQQLLEKWDSYTLKSPIYPRWGKDQVEEIVNSCGT